MTRAAFLVDDVEGIGVTVHSDLLDRLDVTARLPFLPQLLAAPRVVVLARLAGSLERLGET